MGLRTASVESAHHLDGTQYDVQLTAPVEIPGPPPAPLPQAEVHDTPTGVVEARMTWIGFGQKTARARRSRAVLTAPLLTPDGTQVLFRRSGDEGSG